MKQEEIDKMWEIDVKCILGQSLTKEEQEFFNENLIRMKDEMEANYLHWRTINNLIIWTK